MTDKSDRLAMVTGAARGIGRAIAERFASGGWRVIATDKIAAGDFPKGIQFRRMDVSDPGKVKETFDWLQDRTDRLDALINNAALQICKPLVEMAAEEWDAVMATNLRAVFLTAKHSHALLVKARGSIVNVSSVHAIATSKEIAAYAASKGGVVALTRAMALEFADRGVRVNAVLPGAVDTDMLREGLDRGHVAGESSERKLEALGGRVALGRVGKAGEIAEAVFFLADSDRSPYTTGQTLVVDGGAIARLSTE